MTEEWTNEELIRYCEQHCKTEVAMFHKSHISRMMLLAGYSEPQLLNDYYSMHEEMETLCKKARENLERSIQ